MLEVRPMAMKMCIARKAVTSAGESYVLYDYLFANQQNGQIKESKIVAVIDLLTSSQHRLDTTDRSKWNVLPVTAK
jgi:hypothetical protein